MPIVRKSLLIVMALFLVSCHCDECANFDLLSLRLKTTNNSDYLIEHGLALEDVSVITIHDQDTLRADLWPAYDEDPSVVTVKITHQFSKAYILVQGEVKNSMNLGLTVTDSYCCNNMTTINTIEVDNQKRDVSRLDVFDVIVE